MPALCPCHSHEAYAACCKPLHRGKPAATAEALMRSRFSAFVLGLHEYLLSSWHLSTRPNNLTFDPTLWGRLIIHPQNNPSNVHFSAFFADNGGWSVHSELSTFCFENNHWFYLSGTPSISAWKPERNAPCPCGAAKKYKQCCLKK